MLCSCFKQPGFIGFFPPKCHLLKQMRRSFIQIQSRENTNLQQAGGSREAQCERLTADVEGLRVGLLRADRKWVHGSSGGAPTRQPEQGVRPKSHRRVRRIVKVVHSETQGWQTNHECCLDGGSKSSRITLNYSIYTHKNVNKHKKLLGFFFLLNITFLLCRLGFLSFKKS